MEDPMKNILALLHDDVGQEARVQVALDLTRSLGGHLTCVDVCLPPVPSGYDSIQLDIALLEDAQTRETANRIRMEQRLAREDVAWSIVNMTGQIADSIREQAGLADVIVVNCNLDALLGPDMVSVASNLLLKAHKPLVAAPEDCRGIQLSGKAMVAWDGSVAAMAALSATVPLLDLAEEVSLIEFGGSSSRNIEEAAIYLSRHGIPAEVRRIDAVAETADEIARQIRLSAQDFAYVVMGAYGHSRLREWAFGGVTRAMLSSSSVPLVLAH
jgi:nucleotide-binding universal stress UspA family protein